MMATVLSSFGKLDIAVNNVGGSGKGGRTPPGDLTTSLRLTPQNLDGTYELTLKANFMCAQVEAMQMIKQKKGKIIFTASISGTHGTVGSSLAYCATKAGVIQMTKIFANELGKFGINVNSISPGVIDTPMTEKSLENEAETKHLIGRTPMGWVGKPEDLQGAAVFLASEASDFITGVNLVIDGGFTLVPIHPR
jgi:NAD(P)-dependent dehydrogenase (short-subunit alcohol dehydrogenase family)